MKEDRQGFLKVNWPKAKRGRPGPFTCNQATFRSEARNAVQKNFVRSFASGETESVGEALRPPARTGTLFVQRRRGGTPGPPAFPDLHTHSWKSCRGDPYGRPPRLPPARGKLSAGRLTDEGAHLGFIPF